VHLRQEVLLAIESPAEVTADGEEIQEVALRQNTVLSKGG